MLITKAEYIATDSVTSDLLIQSAVKYYVSCSSANKRSDKKRFLSDSIFFMNVCILRDNFYKGNINSSGQSDSFTGKSALLVSI